MKVTQKVNWFGLQKGSLVKYKYEMLIVDPQTCVLIPGK